MVAVPLFIINTAINIQSLIQIYRAQKHTHGGRQSWVNAHRGLARGWGVGVFDRPSDISHESTLALEAKRG